MKESPRPIGNSFFARETCWGNFGRKSMKTESGQRSDIGEGDHILLNKTRDNKLSPNFEPSIIQRGRKERQCNPQKRSGGKHQTVQFEPHEKVSPSTEATEAHGEDEGDDIPTGGHSKAT